MEILGAGFFYAVMGALGGLARLLVTGKGVIPLPRVYHLPSGSVHLNLGFIAPMIIGGLAGLITPMTLGVDGVVAALAGYAGSDGIENLVERFLKK